MSVKRELMVIQSRFGVDGCSSQATLASGTLALQSLHVFIKKIGDSRVEVEAVF
jgi:hypothetical protein